AIPKSTKLLRMALEVVVQGVFQAITPLAIRRDESEERCGQLTPGMKALTFCFDDQTSDRSSQLARRELPYRLHLRGAHATTQPSPAPLGQDLALHLRGVEVQGQSDLVGGGPRDLRDVLRLHPAQELDGVQ